MPVYKFGTDEAGNRVVTADGGKTFEIVRFGTDEAGNRVFKGMESGIVDFIPEGVEQKPAAKPTPNPAFGKQEKVKSITLESEEVPPGPSQEDVNKVLGLSQATGMAQKPLGPSVSDVMAPAGSEAAMIQNVIRGKQTPQERIEAINSLQNTLNRQSQERQQEHAQQKDLELKARSEANLAVNKRLFGPVHGALAQGATDFLVPAAQSVVDTVYGLPNLGRATKALFTRKLANVIFGEGSEGARFFEERTGRELEAVGNSVAENEKIKKMLEKVSSLPGRMTLEGDDRNSMTMRFLTALPSGLGSTSAYMAMSAGVGGVVSKALLRSGASEISALTNGVLVNTLMESGSEAGNAFSEAVQELQDAGFTRDEAMHRAAIAGYKTFAGNVALLGATEAFGTTKDIIKRSMVEGGRALEAKAVRRGWAKIAGKTLFDSARSGFVEGGQELFQSAISGAAKGQAKGEEATVMKQLATPEAQVEGLVGFMVGALTGGAEAIQSASEQNAAHKEQTDQDRMDREFAEAKRQEIEAQRLADEKASAESGKFEAAKVQPARPATEIKSDIDSTRAELVALEKRVKTMKEGSKKQVETKFAIEKAKSRIEALDGELKQSISEAFPAVAGPASADVAAYRGRELNLSPEEQQALIEQMPTEGGVVNKAGRLAELAERGDADRARAKELMRGAAEPPPFHQEVPNAIETMEGTEGNLAEYQGTGEVGQTTEASGGYHPVGSPEAQAQEVTPDFWQSTRDAWEQQKRDMATGAQDVSSVIKNAAELAYAIIKDLARGGVKGAEAFAKYARTVFDSGQIKTIEDHFGSLEALHDHVMAQNEGRTIKIDGDSVRVSDPAQWAQIDELQSDNKARIEAIKGQRMTSEERRTAIAESNKQYEAGLRSLFGKTEPSEIQGEAYGRKFQYLSAGLNPIAAVDQITNGKISELLGISDINNMTPGDYLKAFKKAIGGLAKTTEQTAAKVFSKLRDAGITTGQAEQISNYLHSIGKNAEITEEMAREAMARALQREAEIASLPIEVGSRKDTAGRLSKTFLWLANPFQIDLRHQGFKRVHDAVLDYAHRITGLRREANDAIRAVQDIKTDAMRERVMDALVWMTLHEQVLSKESLKDRGLDDHSIQTIGKIREMVDKYTRQYVVSRTVQHQRNMAKLEARLEEAKEAKNEAEIKSLESEIAEYRGAYNDEMETFGYDPKKIKVVGSGENAKLDGDGGFQQKMYFPLMRNGDHMVEIFDDAGERIANPFIFGNSTAAVEEAFRLAAKQSDKVRKLLYDKAKSGESIEGNYKLKVLPKINKSQGIVFDGSYLKMIASAKRIGGSVLSDMEIALSEMIGNESLKAHMKYRSGFPGYSMDLDFALSAYPRMMANRIAMIENGEKITDAVSTIDKDKDNNAYEAAVRLKDLTLNPGVMTTAAKIFGNLDFIQMLGLVPITPIINRTQPWLVGWNILAEVYGNGEAAKALLRTHGIADAIASKGFMSRNILKGLDEMPVEELASLIRTTIANSRMLDANEKALLTNILVKSALSGDLQARPEDIRGAQDRGSVEEIMRSTEKGQQVANLAGEALSTMSGLMGVGMTWTEVANRIHTISASALLTDKHGWVEVKDDGTPLLVNPIAPNRFDRVLRNAERLNGAINYTGGRGNLSGWKQYNTLLAQSLGRFKSVIIYGATGLHTAAVRSALKAAAGDKSKALGYMKPYVKHHILVSVLAGQGATMVGYPLKLALSTVMKGLDLEKWFKEVVDEAKQDGVQHLVDMGIDKDKAEAAVKSIDTVWGHGLAGMTGADITQSLAPNIIVKGKSLPEAIGYAAAGPSAGQAMDAVMKLWKYSSNWEVAAVGAAKSFQPRFTKGPIEAITGKAKLSGEEGYDLDPWQRFLRGMSVQVTDVTERREIQGQHIESGMAHKDAVSTLQKGVSEGILSRAEAASAIRDYNRGKTGRDRINYTDKAKILGAARMNKRSMREIEKEVARKWRDR